MVLVLALCTALPAFGAKQRTHPARPQEVSNAKAYRGAITVDAATGNVLAEDRADEVSPPASMTKLMTFAVLSDKLASGQIRLDAPVKIEPVDCGMGGTQVFLDPRETFTVEDLVYAMMIQSANDAAHALARFSAGSREAFVEEMNAKARELGMTHSKFRSPHGLPPSSRRIADGDLTTPRDYALLCRYLLLHTDVLKYTSVRQREFGTARAKGPIRMENHNKLLGKVAGVDGLKTGYTAGAGYCLSATAERNGRRVIVVVMGSFGPGGSADYGATRDIKAIEMLEHGFSALPANSNFAAERAKYAKPAVISVDHASSPTTSAAGSHPSPSTPAPTSAIVPAAATPASAPAADGPSIKFALPRK